MSESTCGCSQKNLDKILNFAEFTPCECKPDSFPFVCQRHGGCVKAEPQYNLCRSRYDYFDLYESGRGPCLQMQRPVEPDNRIGAGDVVAKLIHVVTLGYVKPCSRCSQRRRLMNQWGTVKLPRWAAKWFQI